MIWLWLICVLLAGFWFTDVLVYLPLLIVNHLSVPGWVGAAIAIAGLTWLMGD